MAGILQNMAGLGNMTEQVIATDFLLSSKTSIKDYAAALSETASPQVRNVLRKQLDVAISSNEKITNYMLDKGYYQAYNPQEQFKLDMKAAETATSIHV